MPAGDYFALCAPGAAEPVELFNSARFDAYMGSGLAPQTWSGPGSENDDIVRPLIGQICNTPTPTGYTTPQGDNAPWYDPLIPESAGFAGFNVTNIVGLDKAPLSRTVTRKVNGGAALGPIQYQERVIDFEVTLVGATCCAVNYGYRWLTAVLQGCCSNGCEFPDLKFLDSIPTQANLTTCAPGTQSGLLTLPNESNRSPIRTLYSVGLLEGPEVVDRRGGGSCGCGCNPVTTVEFTLVAGLPWIYSDPVTAVAATPLLTGTGECDDPYDWRFCQVPPDCGPANPGYDPQCGIIPPPPRPSSPNLSCFCPPLAYRERYLGFDSAAPDWFEQSTVITVYAGDSALRNATIRFAQTTGNCQAGLLTDCDWCSSLGIEYIPAFASLIIDSVRRKILLDVNGTYYNAERSVLSAEGTPFRWIDIACGSYCVKIESDAFNTDPNANVTIEVATKEL